MVRSKMVFRVLLIVVCSLTLAAVMTGSAAAETDVYLGVASHPFTLDGGNDTCVDHPDSDLGYTTRNCDPINLVFLGRTWEALTADLPDAGTSAFVMPRGIRLSTRKAEKVPFQH